MMSFYGGYFNKVVKKDFFDKVRCDLRFVGLKRFSYVKSGSLGGIF